MRQTGSLTLYPIMALNREDMRVQMHIMADCDRGGRDDPGAGHFVVSLVFIQRGAGMAVSGGVSVGRYSSEK